MDLDIVVVGVAEAEALDQRLGDAGLGLDVGDLRLGVDLGHDADLLAFDVHEVLPFVLSGEDCHSNRTMVPDEK